MTDTLTPNTELSSQLALAIRDHMTRTGITIEGVAGAIGATYSYVQRRVAAQVAMSVDDAYRIADVTGFDLAPILARRALPDPVCTLPHDHPADAPRRAL